MSPVIYTKNAVSDSVISTLIEIYNSSKDYQTKSMKKVSGQTDEVLEVLKGVPTIDTDRIQICHFYKHSTPYYPHTDYHFLEKENIVMPLQVFNGANPYLIVFDQWLDDDGKTWTFESNTTFSHNTGISGRPCDYNIKKSTNKEITKALYRYLSHYPKDYWFGLSGDPYEFKPGNTIQFDSKRLHATSRMHCEAKLGLTIRYKR